MPRPGDPRQPRIDGTAGSPGSRRGEEISTHLPTPRDVGATKQPRRAKNRLSERRLTDGYPWSLVHRAGASDQLRDPAGLESALARPAMYAHYQEADLAMQAAILAHARRPVPRGEQQADGAGSLSHLPSSQRPCVYRIPAGAGDVGPGAQRGSIGRGAVGPAPSLQPGSTPHREHVTAAVWGAAASASSRSRAGWRTRVRPPAHLACKRVANIQNTTRHHPDRTRQHEGPA